MSVSGERRRVGEPGRVGRREIVLATRSRLFETTEAADNGQWPLNRMEDLLLCISRVESAGCCPPLDAVEQWNDYDGMGWECLSPF